MIKTMKMSLVKIFLLRGQGDCILGKSLDRESAEQLQSSLSKAGTASTIETRVSIMLPRRFTQAVPTVFPPNPS